MKNILFILSFFSFIFSSCNREIEKGVHKKDLQKDVEMITTEGTIIIRLSDETPLHRNNFIKLVNCGFYNNVLFHRVIQNFLIQAGDPSSKSASASAVLGEDDLPYTIPKELSPNLFHIRGAITAARTGDEENPEQRSSSTQFTFIQGCMYDDSTLNIAEDRINNYLALNRVIHKPENKKIYAHLQSLVKAKANKDSINHIFDVLKKQVKKDQASNPKYCIPNAQRMEYKLRGGAAHLDRNYTVFGHIVKGLDVVDKIAAIETDSNDRPVRDVKILHTRMIRRKNYK